MAAMGRYQLSRKDAKLNARYHVHLARKNAAEKVEKAKQLKAERLTKESPPTQQSS